LFSRLVKGVGTHIPTPFLHLRRQIMSKEKKDEVTIIVKREFVGDRPISEVLLPIIIEEIKKQMKDGTFGKTH
jgi:hypothetical protein